ncbi:hypothetical protein OH77DRAFT_554558 [Trametes cingulata]|nr:hypothetical protein OH77DRAFT_554558 [Trametes cingulata]
MPAVPRLAQHPLRLQVPRKPVQKALVIGINYTAGHVGGQLQCAHRDAREWRDLLMETYNYRDEDITLMLDEEGWKPELLPTKKNILAQIAKLVDGLQRNSGDRIVFFYAGHTGQLPSDSINEEDGFDECLHPAYHKSWTSDQEPEIILDNDLRRHLVDPLPEGASLTAIFDSCHSGTLLDLDHYLCDAVYFPWLSRGRRRSRSLWQRVERRNAQDIGKVNVRVTSLTPEAAASADLTSNVLRSKADLRVYGCTRTDQGRIVKFQATIDHLFPDDGRKKRAAPKRANSLELARTISSRFKRAPRRSFTDDNKYQKLKDFAFALLKPRSESPEPMNRCTGNCKPVKSPKVHVLSIAACKDPQLTYESRRGKSMTMELVELLKHDPYPRARELVQKLGHRMHETAMKVHAASRKQLEKKKRGQSVRVLDGVNFPEPQLGSLHTLTDDYTLRI